MSKHVQLVRVNLSSPVDNAFEKSLSDNFNVGAHIYPVALLC